ncbi:unnamed protein product [Rhizophagus irregularis]|nr:unnamed protein product [Rhizophagus irregularis]
MSDDTLQDDESDDDQPLELVSRFTFANWDRFKKWLDRFALKEGFDYKIRTSEKEQGILRRVAYECTKSSSHNPQITLDPIKHSPRFCKLTPKMLEDIEKYVNQGRMDSGSIYPLLRHDYSDQPIHKKDLYNVIYQFLIDNNYKTRIVVNAIIEDETLDTYRWIFDTILTETGVYPRVIFTDSDPSMIHSIKEIYPNTQHLLCIFHIDLNLRKKLKGKLGSQFEEFHHKFYVCRNSLCDEELFECKWNQLVNQYPAAAKYLSESLYVKKESWAIPWVYKQFTTGAQSTQRIESINKHIHDKVNRATSLCDLLHSIKNHVKNEEHLEKFKIERNALPKVGMPMLNTRFFGQMNTVIKDFLTSVMLENSDHK